jgi:hypothetical protein
MPGTINMLNVIEFNGDINWVAFTIQFAMAFTGCFCLLLVALELAGRRRAETAEFQALSVLPVSGHSSIEAPFPAVFAPARFRVNGITVRVPRMRFTDFDSDRPVRLRVYRRRVA